MRTEILLIYPIIASLILLITRTRRLNNIALILYAILYPVVSACLYLNQVKLEGAGRNLFDAYFRIDQLNILFLLVLAIIFAGVSFYNLGFSQKNDIDKYQHTYYSVAILMFVFSMTGAILSSNLGVSWIFIEATTLASAYLIYFNKTKHALEAAWKYVFICSIGISLAFVGVILLTIAAGNINSLLFADLYNYAEKLNPFWLKLSFVFILVGLGTKMGLAPVHAWLPDAHSEAPSPISALLSAALLNSAFLVILRVYKLMEITHLEHYARFLLFSMGILSLFITAVFVFNINNYKRMLAYSSIENMGIITIGIAVGGAGVYAAMLHLIGHSLVKASFFLTAGNILKLYETKKISEISGIIQIDKTTGWLWVLSFLGIAGLPPSPLFLSEFILLKAMFEQNQIAAAITIMILLTLIIYGIGKSVIKMSFGEMPVPILSQSFNKLSVVMYLPQIALLTTALAFGVYIPPYINQIINNAVLAISSI